jgi:prepilin-type N-terminal cleavage/methylation domain-containing protein
MMQKMLKKGLAMKTMKDIRGFTAAEIITVVAIISILALIVIPKFWSRTEEARIARAQEEMARISDAESFAYAETGFYYFPGNLQFETASTTCIMTTWNFQSWYNGGKQKDPGIGSGYEIETVSNWKGPYITYQRTEVLNDTMYAPLDPWKNPYIFFGPITLSSNSNDTVMGSKIRIWSRGPNLKFDSSTSFPWGPAEGDDILYVR